MAVNGAKEISSKANKISGMADNLAGKEIIPEQVKVEVKERVR